MLHAFCYCGLYMLLRQSSLRFPTHLCRGLACFALFRRRGCAAFWPWFCCCQCGFVFFGPIMAVTWTFWFSLWAGRTIEVYFQGLSSGVLSMFWSSVHLTTIHGFHEGRIETAFSKEYLRLEPDPCRLEARLDFYCSCWSGFIAACDRLHCQSWYSINEAFCLYSWCCTSVLRWVMLYEVCGCSNH